jgi:hypothetical protein
MEKIFSFFLGAIALSAPLRAQDDPRVPFAQTVSKDDLRKHLTIIASDEYEGRDTGSKGQKMAAEYIANHFKSLGLVGPVTANANPYYQTVPLERKKKGEAYLQAKKSKFENLKDFVIYGDFGIPKTKVELVYGGYGLQGDKYSDFGDLDVKDKYVVVLAGEPKGASGNYLMSGGNSASPMASPQRKAGLAREKGVKLLIIVSDTDEAFGRTLGMFRSMSGGSLGFPAKDQSTGTGLMFTSPTVAAAMFGLTPEKWKALATDISQSGKTNAGSLKAKVKLKVENQVSQVPSENVLGYMEGTDKKDEVVVITAHYDHVGITDGKVYNGADDDGSGTVTVLELAEAFAKAKAAGKGPRRSILFMTVTGEERGLLGSQYYSENPIFPLKSTVVDLNIDMVGRVDKKHEGQPNYIYIIGSDMLSTDLHKLSEDVAARFAPDVALDYTYNSADDPNRFYYRSDHYNFAKHNIPVIFYFNGTHEDYHQPTDDVEKINFDKMEKIARLIFHTAWEVANRDARPVVDKAK